jgi:hypothetical protein
LEVLTPTKSQFDRGRREKNWKKAATGTRRLFLGLFLGGGQNIKKRGVFAAARLDVGPFSFYFFFIFQLFFKIVLAWFL